MGPQKTAQNVCMFCREQVTKVKKAEALMPCCFPHSLKIVQACACCIPHQGNLTAVVNFWQQDSKHKINERIASEISYYKNENPD